MQQHLRTAFASTSRREVCWGQRPDHGVPLHIWLDAKAENWLAFLRASVERSLPTAPPAKAQSKSS